MTKDEAEQIAGSLSYTHKMPGPSTSLNRIYCKTGAKLAKTQGTVCSRCYAARGNYMWPGVKAAMERRQNGLTHPQWVEAMVTLIAHSGTDYFRIHDSGDFQSLRHLTSWTRVAKALSDVRFWAPTHEFKLVKRWLAKYGKFPENLVIRISADKIDETPPTGWLGSMVVSTGDTVCKAHKRGNQCGACRLCWDKAVTIISYPLK